MKEFAAFFANGAVVSFEAYNTIFAEARAHKVAENRGWFLETVVEVVDVEHVKEAA